MGSEHRRYTGFGYTGMGSCMTFVDKVLRRVTVAAGVVAVLPGLIGVAGGSASAGAYSRAGLPVEYLEVPSAGMGRSARATTW